MAKSRLRLVTPTTKIDQSHRAGSNGTLRTREHLTNDEVERLIKAARNKVRIREAPSWKHRFAA